MGNIDKKKICETCERNSRTCKKRNSTQDMMGYEGKKVHKENNRQQCRNIDKNRTKQETCEINSSKDISNKKKERKENKKNEIGNL